MFIRRHLKTPYFSLKVGAMWGQKLGADMNIYREGGQDGTI